MSLRGKQRANTTSMTYYNFTILARREGLMGWAPAFRTARVTCVAVLAEQRNRDTMLVHVLREYNLNRIFLSHLGLWPFQNKVARNCISIFCLVLEISYYPFEVIICNTYFECVIPSIVCGRTIRLTLRLAQVLMFYDHRDDAQMVFESCYQLVISSAFLVRLWNGIWNRDKVNVFYTAIWLNRSIEAPLNKFLLNNSHPWMSLFFCPLFLIAILPRFSLI